MTDIGAGNPIFCEDWRHDGRGWYVCHTSERFALTRRLPLRWDVWAEARLPDLGRRRLAHAIRQDMWRLLQRVRGFAPAVVVQRDGTGLRVRAGGCILGAGAGALSVRVAQMLADPRHRAAWGRAAAHGRVT